MGRHGDDMSKQSTISNEANPMKTPVSPLRIFCAFVSVLFYLACTAWAQSATATLTGMVTDEKGAVISGATITVTNDNTRLTRQTKTSGEGYFSVPLLPPNTYTVKVERDGFAPAEARHVVLNVNDQVALNIQLKVGALGAAVG